MCRLRKLVRAAGEASAGRSESTADRARVSSGETVCRYSGEFVRIRNELIPGRTRREWVDQKNASEWISSPLRDLTFGSCRSLGPLSALSADRGFTSRPQVASQKAAMSDQGLRTAFLPLARLVPLLLARLCPRGSTTLAVAGCPAISGN